MKRCRWCHRIIWPWQRSRRDNRVRLHLQCLRAIHQMTLRDEEESEVSTGV